MTRVAVHVGYHKTATTWFQREILPRHPSLRAFVAGSPQASVFLNEIIGRSDREFDEQRARAAFDARLEDLDVPSAGVVVVSAERLSGHAASGGYDTFRIARRLGAVVPEAMVFFAVREQVSMIESEYRQLVLEGSPARLADLVARRPNWIGPGFDLSHYRYDLLADEYARIFGTSRLRVFSFDEIVTDPAGYLRELAAFLEIDPWPPLSDSVLESRVNPGVAPRLLGLRRRLNHLQRSSLNPEPALALRPVWRGPLSAAATRLPRRRTPLLDPTTRAYLREYFHESNDRLAQRYGVRL